MKHLQNTELDKLKAMWENSTREELLAEFPDRKFASLASRARKLGIKSNFHKNTKATGQTLLNESNKSFYWLGFIMADGHFSNNGRICIAIDKRDSSHLGMLADFVKVAVRQTKKGNPSISFADSGTSKIIKDRFKVANRKSYEPPTLPKLSDDRFISFLCGYIDGDGCISKQGGRKYTNKKGVTKQYERNDFLLQVKCHSSWIYLITNFGQRLCKIFGKDENLSKTRIDSKGYLVWRIYNTPLIKELKQKATELGLPLMERKWNKIN